MTLENSNDQNPQNIGGLNWKHEPYSIVIDSVSNFRYELIKMIEKVRYNIDGYEQLSSSQ